MQINKVNSINFSNNIYFAQKQNKKENIPEANESLKQRMIHKLSGPAVAAMFLVPIAVTTPSCKDYVSIDSKTIVNLPIVIPIVPPNHGNDTINHHDTIYQNDTINYHDTIYHNDTINKNDTIYLKDTIYIPADPIFSFPYEIEDSLNYWRKNVLDVDAEGDDNSGKEKALLYASGTRDWNLFTPEYIKLNLIKSNDDEAVYDHVTGSYKDDIRISKVDKGDITVVKKDGTETDNISGLLFNEDGVKTFAHSANGDKIVVYHKATSGENRGKFVEAGTVEPGYLPESKYGQTVLLNGILGEDMQDHYTNVKSKVMDIDKMRQMATDAIVIE